MDAASKKVQSCSPMNTNSTGSKVVFGGLFFSRAVEGLEVVDLGVRTSVLGLEHKHTNHKP